MESKNKDGEKRSKAFYFILIFRIISIIVIVVCLYILYLWNQDNNANKSLQNDLSNLISITDNSNSSSKTPGPYDNILDEDGVPISQFNVDFKALLEQNQDSVGWVRIPNTNISFPIVQTDDNEFYLTHNLSKEKNGAGWIFADYRNNFDELDPNTIIYGHNRRNGTMFSNLKLFLDPDYCAEENRKYIIFNTLKKNYIAEIFSVYKVSSDNFTVDNVFESDEKFNETLNNWKGSSVYDFGTEVSTSDKILTLYTCDNNTSYRILIHAKLVPLE